MSKDKSTLLSGYAIGKKISIRTRTKGDNAAPTLKPYREHKAWGIICDQTLGWESKKVIQIYVCM